MSIETGLILLFDGMDSNDIAAALNKAVSSEKYWPVVREWMRLNGDQAAILAAEDIVTDLDDRGYVPVKSLEEVRAAANAKVWNYEIDDQIYEALGYHRDDIRAELLEEGFIKEVGDAEDDRDQR